MESTRRDFLSMGAIALPATLAVANAQGLNIVETTPTIHTLPTLDYSYSDLEPFIDAKTMEIHHSKHHQAYVNGLNKAEEMLFKARADGDYSLVQHWTRQLAFHGGGHALHSLFWKSMKKPIAGISPKPSGSLMVALQNEFGSFDTFKKHFSATANSVEGGGWALLSLRTSDKRLLITQIENQQKQSYWNCIPLLAVDVWEHAYYLKYQNKRSDYVEAWWNVVNWDATQQFYNQALKF